MPDLVPGPDPVREDAGAVATEEPAGTALAVQGAAVSVVVDDPHEVVDTCGTGGDGAGPSDTGAHELDNALEQVLLTRGMGERRIVAGFGIPRPEQVRALCGHADAVVVGSATVAEITRGRDPLPLAEELRSACTR